MKPHIAIIKLFLAASLIFVSELSLAKIADRQAHTISCTRFLSSETKPRHHSAFKTRFDLIKTFASFHSQESRHRRSFLQRFYGNELMEKLLNELTAIHPELSPLMFDLGILHHLPEFLEYVENEIILDKSKIDPWLIREKFSMHLGTRKVFRAITLTDAELEIVKTYGIESRLLRNYVTDDWLHYDYILQATYDSHALGVGSQIHFENTFLLSVSEHTEVSVAVANSHLADNKNVYLFELEVPHLDIMPIGDRISFIRPSLTPPARLLLTQESDQTVKKVPFGRKLESFIMFRIDPSEIIKITKIDIKNPLASLYFEWQYSSRH